MSEARLRSSLIRLAHAHPEFREALLPLVRQGSSWFHDIANEVGGVIGEKIRDHVDGLRVDLHEARESLARIERAWSQWDIETLLDEGALSDRDVKMLNDIWEAQQAGDEAAMARAESRLASERKAGAYITANPRYSIELTIDSAAPRAGKFPSGVAPESLAWDVSGTIGIYTLTLMPQKFSCVMYIPPRGGDRVYMSEWDAKVKGEDAKGWLLRAMDDLLRERAHEVIQVLKSSSPG